jgi:Tol biopolymer transport system component
VLSSDGTRVAGVRIEDKRSEIWIADAVRGAATRLTHADTSTSPVWSADGRTVYFAARSDGGFELWRREADGTAPAARLQPSTRNAFPLAASPDGGYLAFLQTNDRASADIWLLPLGGGAARPAVESAFDEGAASFSPDSTLLAFESAESGTWQVYLLRLRDGRRLLVSADGGRRPLWRSDGLYFEAGRSLMKATIDETGLAVQSLSVAVPDLNGRLLGLGDGGRLLIHRVPEAAASNAVVTVDWLRELRTLLGPAVAEPPR